jgi:hypothetical protein
VDTGRRVSRRDDKQVREAVQYLRHLRRCQGDMTHQRLARRYPALYLAHGLYTGEPTFQRWELEARLLTPEPFDVVGPKCGSSAEVVGTYHEVFFAVRPCLYAKDYIVNRVLGRKAHVGLEERDVGLILKIYALAGGSLAVDALVDYFRDSPVVPERPELLTTEEMEALRGQLLIRAAILARTLPADDPKTLRKLTVLQQAMALLRDDWDQDGKALAGPLRPAIDLPQTAPAATGVAGDSPAQVA